MCEQFLRENVIHRIVLCRTGDSILFLCVDNWSLKQYKGKCEPKGKEKLHIFSLVPKSPKLDAWLFKLP